VWNFGLLASGVGFGPMAGGMDLYTYGSWCGLLGSCGVDLWHLVVPVQPFVLMLLEDLSPVALWAGMGL
jgi:hypothetical protein